MTDIKLFNETAKHQEEEYANPERSLQKRIKELMDMGFIEQQSKDVLNNCGEDVEKAVTFLLDS